MSIFSILQNANHQQFNLQNGKDARKSGAHLSVAENLKQAFSTPGADNAEDGSAAKSLFEDYKEAVEVSSSLSRSAESGKDDMRQERINRIEQRIEQLKELLKFATPEQAKRLMKELKQIAREFKTASQELKKAGQDLGSGGLNATASALGGAVNSVIEAVSSPTSAPGTLSAATAIEAGSSVIAATENSAIEADSASAQTNTANLPLDEGNASTDLENGEDQQGANGSLFDLRSAVQAYEERLTERDEAYRQGRISGMREDHKKLGKIAADIKYMAAQLERLAEKDDEEAEEDLKDIRDDLADGLKDLDDPGLKDALGLGPAGSEATVTQTASTLTFSTSTVSTGIVV